MKKAFVKTISLLLVLLCILPIFAGCSGKEKVEFDIQAENISDDPLVICLGVNTLTTDGGAAYDDNANVKDFMYALEHTGGLTDVAFISIPPSGAIEEWLGWGISNNYFNKPLTLIPMYSDDGGVTANIEAYAAINRNTKHADEAFTAIDVLMSRNVQQRNQMYTMYFANFAKFPMHEELFRENTDIANQYMTEENFNELCEVRDQITVANFGGRQREVLNEMLIHCRAARENNESIEEIVHEAYADLERRVKE